MDNQHEILEMQPLITKRQRFYKNPTVAMESLGQSRHASHYMEVLLHASQTLMKKLSIPKLLQQLLEILFQEIPSDRGIIFLYSSKTKAWRPLAIKIRKNLYSYPKIASRTIMSEVLRTGEGILTQDAMQDKRFQTGLSIAMQKIHAAICVPLVGKNEKVFGLLHLDSLRCGETLDEDHLKLMTAIAMQAAMAIENTILSSRLEEQKLLDQELRIASSIQKKLLPEANPQVTGLKVYGLMLPARKIGGDYYDFVFSEDKKKFYVCAGDVSGKGIPASLVMVMARCFMRSTISRSSSTREILCEVNRLLKANIRENTFMSMILLQWDIERQCLSWTGAGHEHLLVFRAQTGLCQAILSGGMVLGISLNAEKSMIEQNLELASGDSVFLYSDGVTESRNSQKDMFELYRLIQSVQQNGHLQPEEMCQAILQDIRHFCGNAPQYDDITLVAIRKL